MFAAQVRKTVTIDGVDVVVRKLSWRSLENAQRKGTIAAVQAVRDLGIDINAPREELVRKAAQTEAQKEAATYAGYDTATVLQAGIVSWSSDVQLPAGIDELDAESMGVLKAAILDLSIPEPDQKKD